MPPKDKFADLVRFLKKEYPNIKFKVYRRKPSKNFWGWCTKDKKGNFIIIVDKDTSYGGQVFMLMHEFGHVLSYHTDSHETSHGDVFGIKYAEGWRAYEKWVATPWKTQSKTISQKK